MASNNHTFVFLCKAVCKDALGGPTAPFLLLPGPRPTLSGKRAQRITLPQRISLPPGEKGQPSLPPPFHLKPSSPPLRPSALHLSRGSLQSQDNLETSAGSLPETLKKSPPSLLFSLSPHLSCTPLPHLSAPPALLLITGTLLYFSHSAPPFLSPPLQFRSFLPSQPPLIVTKISPFSLPLPPLFPLFTYSTGERRWGPK